MGKLVLLNDRNQIIKTLDDDIAEREVDAFLKDYERLVANETDLKRLVAENEIKLNAILSQLSQPKIERYLYPTFAAFLDEYEARRKLGNKLQQGFINWWAILISTVKVGLIRGVNYLAKKIKK